MDDLAPLLRRAAALAAGQPGATGMTPAEARILRVLHETGTMAPSALAARLGVTRGAVTRLVDRLRAKRLVVRAAGGRADRRFQTIALTGAGALTAARMAPADPFARLTPGERARLAALLAKALGER